MRPSRPIRQLRALPSAEPFEPRGRVRIRLLRDLAMGEWTPKSLAARYGVSMSAIVAFSEKYADDVAEVGAALSGTLNVETAGIWAARKQERLAELQQGIDDIDATLDELREQGIKWSRAHRDMFRARLELYRMIADELGAYPQRQAPPVRTGNTVTYVIETEDPGALT